MNKEAKRSAFILAFIFIALIATFYIVSYNSNQKNDAKTEQAYVPPELTPAEIYNDVNEARHDAGVQALTYHPRLITAAEQKCQNMVDGNYYDHVNPQTGEHGYMYAVRLVPEGKLFNENLNEGDLDTSKAFVKSWLDSPNHKATMLDPIYNATGVAICHPKQDPMKVIIVQEFVQLPQ